MALTAKQQQFISEFLLDLNATQAAIRAGYSKETADKQGPRLLSHPEIKAAIDAAKIDRCERTGVDAAWVLKRLIAEAEADLADLYDAKGDLRPVEEWPQIWRQGLVAGVEIDALYEGAGGDRRQVGHVKKIRLSDRLRRLELIGKHVRVNAFQEQVVHSLDDLGDRLNRAQARVAAQLVIGMTPALPAPSTSLPVDAVPASVAAPAERTAPAAPAAPPAPPPPPKPTYRPIMPPAPERPWPTFGDTVVTDYDPTA